MKFERRNATGKAGERALETFVEEQLKLIYRRVDDPDIGIDGEIEIIDKDRASTGGLLKAQVKATEDDVTGKRHRVALDEEHLDYFASLTVPPILVAVSLPIKKIWWKPILHKDSYRGPKGGYGVTFDLTKDRLTTASGLILKMIGDRSNAIIARYLIKEVEEALNDIDEGVESGNYDLVTAEFWAQALREADQSMREAETLLKYERRYTQQITKVGERFEEAAWRIELRKEWFKEHGAEHLLNGERE